MNKQQTTALILGEGITEFYYFESLRDKYKWLQLQPDYPKHTNLKELRKKIDNEAKKGYNYIFCVIDMDTKDTEPEKKQYAQLKARYANAIDKPQKGIHCQVEFFETHRCTELFFLYYFQYTSREFLNQDELLKTLNKHVAYQKTASFFSTCKGGLHTYLGNHNGSIDTAISNATKSMKDKEVDCRTYTYSELGNLMRRLEELDAERNNRENVEETVKPKV